MNVLFPLCSDFQLSLPSRWFVCVLSVQVNRGHVKGRSWLFVSQCWLAVSKGDGRVERMLQVCTQGIGFAKVEHSHTHKKKKPIRLIPSPTSHPGSPPVCLQMLSLKLFDYLADHHIWISVHSCPRPNSFTHTERLSVSLLLLSAYACANTVIISQMDDQVG